VTSIAHPSGSNVETIQCVRATHDVSLNLDPRSSFWRDALPISFEGDNYGRPVKQMRTEVRSRWTDGSLYLLFVCPYQKLNLKPSPQTTTETNHLWNWDVAEAFIGSDFEHIRRYKEFELSPQGEWLDLDINLERPQHEDGWRLARQEAVDREALLDLVTAVPLSSSRPRVNRVSILLLTMDHKEVAVPLRQESNN
jgi:hypothetical protein